VTTTAAREVWEEVPPETPEPDSKAQESARARESSVTDGPGLPSEGSPESVTERNRWAWLTGVPAKAQTAAAGVTSGASLLHARPPSLAESRERHHVAAGHFEAGLIRWPRIAWGYFHLAVKTALHVIEWVTESPPRLLVAGGLIVVLKLWA
jgi:hypothetical protein